MLYLMLFGAYMLLSIILGGREEAQHTPNPLTSRADSRTEEEKHEAFESWLANEESKDL